MPFVHWMRQYFVCFYGQAGDNDLLMRDDYDFPLTRRNLCAATLQTTINHHRVALMHVSQSQILVNMRKRTIVISNKKKTDKFNLRWIVTWAVGSRFRDHRMLAHYVFVSRLHVFLSAAAARSIVLPNIFWSPNGLRKCPLVGFMRTIYIFRCKLCTSVRVFCEKYLHAKDARLVRLSTEQ